MVEDPRHGRRGIVHDVERPDVRDQPIPDAHDHEPLLHQPLRHGALAARETAAVEPHHHRCILRIGRAGHVEAAHPTRIVAGGIRTVEDVTFEAVIGRTDGTGEQETEKQKEEAFHVSKILNFINCQLGKLRFYRISNHKYIQHLQY